MASAKASMDSMSRLLVGSSWGPRGAQVSSTPGHAPPGMATPLPERPRPPDPTQTTPRAVIGRGTGAGEGSRGHSGEVPLGHAPPRPRPSKATPPHQDQHVRFSAGEFGKHHPGLLPTCGKGRGLATGHAHPHLLCLSHALSCGDHTLSGHGHALHSPTTPLLMLATPIQVLATPSTPPDTSHTPPCHSHALQTLATPL